MEEKKEFRTTQLALTAFLELYGRESGVRFIKTEIIKDKNNKLKVEFVFADPAEMCKDLELEFRYSECKRYRDLLFFYKKQITETLGGI